ncbi:MAG: cyclic nucleotide-binding domain-containing protein, partial [Myxococcota bacterium]
MTDKPEVSHEELMLIPILRGLAREELDQFMALFEPAQPSDGVLFEASATAEALYLISRGSVSLYQDEHEIHKLHPTVIIGEVGALTGRKRMTRALVSDDAQVWQIRVGALNQLFEDNKDLGLHFETKLLAMLADKLDRDQIRLRDMRANIVHTQKAMKQMR